MSAALLLGSTVAAQGISSARDGQVRSGSIHRTATPISVQDILEERRFPHRSAPALSPDGQWVAYALQRQSDRQKVDDPRFYLFSRRGVSVEAQGASLWVTNIDAKSTVRIGSDASSSWAPAWSPDGRFLAYYSDEGGTAAVWLWDRVTGKGRQLSERIARPLFLFETPQWTRDGRKVLIKALPAGLSIEEAAALLDAGPAERQGSDRVRVFESSAGQQQQVGASSGGARNRYLSDLVAIEIENGQETTLAARITPIQLFISPDGARIAYAEYLGEPNEGSQQTVYDIKVVTLDSGTLDTVASRVPMRYGMNLSWSADGKKLAYVTSGPKADGDCYVADIVARRTTLLTPAPHPSFADTYRPPLWDKRDEAVILTEPQGVWVYPLQPGRVRKYAPGQGRETLGVVAHQSGGQPWSPNRDGSLYAVTRDPQTKRMGLARLALDGSPGVLLFEEDIAFASRPTFGFDVAGKHIVYVAEDSAHGQDLWLGRSDKQSLHRDQVTHVNAHLEKYLMGRPMLVSWRTSSDREIKGVLLLPADYQSGTRYPTVVDVYGGRISSESLNRFGVTERGVSNHQMLATRGYVVFVPDIPLQTDAPMRELAEVVMPGVDKIVAMGIADPQRLVVTGRSYGGYCALSLIVQTDRFRAAVSRGGLGNLLTDYGSLRADGSTSTGWAEEGQGRLGGTPWAVRERYIENSPWFFLDRVVTPLLLVHGAADTTLAAALSDEVYVGLSRLGKEVRYVRYRYGEHTEDSFDREDAADYFSRLMAWLDSHVGSANL